MYATEGVAARVYLAPSNERLDPDQALIRIIDAALAGDADELEEAAHDLGSYLRAGGFKPAEATTEYYKNLKLIGDRK
jgi:hypothetical protein